MGKAIREKNNILVIVILVIAAIVRLWAVTSVPPSPSLDEVSIGYNAYSLLHTGKDEYGYFLPILLRAYDDWRPALYVYMVIPFIALFGLNSFAVRLPSIILSLGTIYLSYKVVAVIFGKTLSWSNKNIRSEWIAFGTAFLIAISPWNIYLSRLGHEVNIGLFFTVLCVYSFFSGILNNKKMLLVSGVCFGLSFYTYQSEKVIIPILFTSLIILFRKDLKKNGKIALISGGIFLIIALPAILSTLSPQGMTRFRGTSVFSNTSVLYEESAKNVLRAKRTGNKIEEIFYNRRFVPIRTFMSQYLSHFNPSWLFLGGERENHKVPYMGLLYLFEGPFLITGLVSLLFISLKKRYKLFLYIWFLSSPLPASLTTDAPHAMRAFTFFPTMQAFEAIGFFTVFVILANNILRISFISGFAATMLLGIVSFLRGYFVIFPNSQADSFQSALLSSMIYLNGVKNNYDSIIVSNQKNLYQSYMFYLYASKYDPLTYLNAGGTGSGGYAVTHKIGKVEFRPITWQSEKKNNKVLFFGNHQDFDSGTKIIRQFHYPDEKDGVVVVSYE